MGATSGTPDFTPFGEFMISLIIYAWYITEFVSFRSNESGSFAWISLTAFSRTYFIIDHNVHAIGMYGCYDYGNLPGGELLSGGHSNRKTQWI